MEHTFKLTDTIPPTPHDSPLTGGYTPGSDEGWLKLLELMNSCTTLSNKITTLENELSSTKSVYHLAFITLTKKVKKLETQLKQKRSRTVIHSSNEEEPSLGIKDSPKQGRMIREIDKDETINLSTVKDKEKGIMQETELPRKINKREMIQLSLDEELAQKLHAEELAKETARQEQERYNLEKESSKKQKLDEQTEDEVEAQAYTDQEIEEMKLYVKIVPNKDVAIDAIPLATKPSVTVEYKIVKKGKIIAKMKVIKEESKIIGLLMIDDDFFTRDTPLGMIFNEFNRLSGMDDDLFIYKGKIPELSCSPKVIFINKILVMLIDITVDQWLDLKYGLKQTYSNETPLCEAVKEFNFLLKIDVDVLTNDILGFKTYDEYKDARIYEWNKDVPWVANMPWLDYEPWMEPSDDIEHVCKLFRFKNRHAKWATCNWKNKNYCNYGDLPRVIQIGDMIYFESHEWYENLKDRELKDEALNSKTIFEGSRGINEESSDNARTHCLTIDEWDDFEHANHIGADDNSKYNAYLDVSKIFNDRAGIKNDYET
nr:hypothetical protein [Tanacetum cinerariifolium]GEV39928.1 hypothetical protein [Tanacetum cinerariifolium]